MGSAGRTSRARGFLVALMRNGAAVIADVPADMSEQVVDPSPQPGWRRISLMATSTGRPSTDTLLIRACRYVVLVPLMYRVVAAPVMLLSYLASEGSPNSTPVAVVAALTMLLNAGALVWMLRVPGLRGSVARVLIIGDALVAVAVNLYIAMAVPDPHYDTAAAVAWIYLLGTVALWTLAWGVPAGLLLIVLSVPLRLLQGFLGGHTDPMWTGPVRWGGDLVGQLAALVTAMVMLILIGLGTRLALVVGVRRGREAEQARSRRELHDTVLQTLEAMALPLPVAPDNLEAALAALTELRGIARAEAMQLRQGLAERTGDGASGLGEDLAGIAAEMAREGLRAQLVFSDVDGASLSENRRLAVRDAVREAMRNTMKHAGTAEVVLRVEQRDGGIAVIARDHGDGFDATECPPGFGISHSISARLREVGGSAEVESAPGDGTRVTLWVPF
jgi:signal transduction histidine kinase